jgi:DNA-binding transcriptional LysR family regulator
MNFIYYNMSIMDTRLLKTFLVLSKTKNFTKASKLLFLSQSAISLQINRLESLIGKSLFSRDKRNVTLTEEGEVFIGYAHQMLNLEGAILAHFSKRGITGEIKIGTPEDIATGYLPKILAEFSRSYPDILLNVTCDFTVNLIKNFNEYDLILVKQDPKNPILGSIPLCDESLVWVGSKEKKLRYLNCGSLPLILAPSPCVYRQRALDVLSEHCIKWRMAYTSTSLAGSLAAVNAGLGVCVLPINRITKELQIIDELPPLKGAEIALLVKEGDNEAKNTFKNHLQRCFSSSFDSL